MKKIYLFFTCLAISAVTSAQLVLNEAYFDAGQASDDTPEVLALLDANRDGTTDPVQDKFIELVNTGATALDISGYNVYDKSGLGSDTPRHVVPDGTSISAGGIYVVFGGGDLTTIKAALPNVIFHTASTGDLSLSPRYPDDELHVKDANGDSVIDFNPKDFFDDASDRMSFARKSSISGAFVRHYGINQTFFSPGELVYNTDAYTTGFVLNEILFVGKSDANGDGSIGSKHDEFMEFYNNSGAPLDISGYKIFDLFWIRQKAPAVPRHIVPVGTIIPAGGVYLLFGGGTPTGAFGDNTTVATCSSGAIDLSEGGDCLFVLDASDKLVLSLDSSELNIDLKGDQSATRSPEITGPFVLTEAGVNYSPGTKTNGGGLSAVSFTENNVKVYLTNNNTSLKIEGQLEGENNLKIYNMLGKEVFKISFNTEKTNLLTLPSLQKGIYIIQMSNSSVGSLSKKIIIN